jgi:hypothetical protein
MFAPELSVDIKAAVKAHVQESEDVDPALVLQDVLQHNLAGNILMYHSRTPRQAIMVIQAKGHYHAAFLVPPDYVLEVTHYLPLGAIAALKSSFEDGRRLNDGRLLAAAICQIRVDTNDLSEHLRPQELIDALATQDVQSIHVQDENKIVIYEQLNDGILPHILEVDFSVPQVPTFKMTCPQNQNPDLHVYVPELKHFLGSQHNFDAIRADPYCAGTAEFIQRYATKVGVAIKVITKILAYFDHREWPRVLPIDTRKFEIPKLPQAGSTFLIGPVGDSV